MGRVSPVGQNTVKRAALGSADSRVQVRTQGAVGTQRLVVAGQAFSGSPAVVLSPLDDVDLLKLILTHIATEYASPPLFGLWVATVHGAPPHVADAISVHLRARARLVFEGVVVRDPVEWTSVVVVHIDAKDFTQEGRPEAEGQTGGPREDEEW